MRITSAMLFRTALADVNALRARLADTQEKASSGLAINRPSDDPVGASAALLLRAGIDATEQFETNLVQARNRVGILESSIGDAMGALIDARTVALEGANETIDAGGRAILAQKVEALHERLLAEANTRNGGTFVFAGSATDASPFVASGPFQAGLPSPTVAYVGDANEVETPIDDGITATTTLDGGRIFRGDADGDGNPDPGSEDLFAILGDLRDALLADDTTAISATVARFDTGIDHLSVERTRVGMTDLKIADWEGRLADRKLDLQTRLSEVQDADLAVVISDLVQQENALRVALDSTTRLTQTSLLDFL